MDASLMKASALRLRFSQSLASRRQRLSQAMVRSTTQRLGLRGGGAKSRDVMTMNGIQEAEIMPGVTDARHKFQMTSIYSSRYH